MKIFSKSLEYYFYILLAFFLGYKAAQYNVFPINRFLERTIFDLTGIDIKRNININSTITPTVTHSFILNADVAFIGDSLTARASWSKFFPNIKVLNAGVGGDKTADIIARLDDVIAARPERAYLMIGINDIFRNINSSKILENYALIVDKLLSAKIDITIQSTIQCDISICGLEYVKTIEGLNSLLVELAQEKKVNFLHLDKLSDKYGLNAKYTSDGVHLNEKGYIYWAQVLTPSIN